MDITNKIFFLILIYEFNFIYYLYASTTNNVMPSNRIGRCKMNQTILTPVTVWETINEPHILNYPCNNGSEKVCTKHTVVTKKVQRTVSIKGSKLVNVCCKGYKKVGKTCEPKCHPECQHGKCIKPDTCQCDQGYKPLTNSKCTPDCQNCQNGYCLTPTDCKCYSQYEKTDNGTCVPRCDPKCVNGDCLTLDVCTCHAGYEADALDKHICNPICQIPCGEGGSCIAPDVCKCAFGYRLNAIQQCEAVCDSCTNGVCIKPGECACNAKYESITKIVGHKFEIRCEPVCQVPCEERGRCIEPDVCECSSGYRLNATQQCEPVCDNCENGVCIKPGECVCNKKYENKVVKGSVKVETGCTPICQLSCGNGGHCIAPDICECSSDYRLNATKQCEPICENCDNGVCIKPGKCVCNENYETKPTIGGIKSEKRCLPICQVPCGDGGQCIAPNVCECSYDYRLNKTLQCEPICEGCENGVCIRPAECVCNENYERKMVNISRKIEMKCTPICQVPCGDGGHCVAPNVCECISDYRLNATQQCEPICESCENGICIRPAECLCYENYESKMRNVGHKIEMRCEPICIQPCVNGVCSGVNECTCDEGYERDEKTKHICNRICNPPCINGRCSVDNKCVCLSGFLAHSFKHHVCVDCNFTCTESEDCSMPEGCPCPDSEEFNMDTNICERSPVTTAPQCNGECINSNCTYGQCICYDGFNKLFAESNTCFPLCNNKWKGCIKGDCSAPDVCDCFDGYTLSPHSKFECILIEPTLMTTVTEPTTKSTSSIMIPTTTSYPSSSTSSPSIESVQRSDYIIDQGSLNQIETECIEGKCQSEMDRIQEGEMFLKAHYNYILIVVGIAVVCVIIIFSMIYRKYNRTKTFKTHEQETFLSSPYFIGGPIKTSCDIELEES